MKIYVIAAVLLSVIAYLVWDGRTKWQAGFDSANAKHLAAINKANADHAEVKGVLIRKHIKETRDAADKTAKTIKRLRSSSDGCLDARMPAVTLERVRDERSSN